MILPDQRKEMMSLLIPIGLRGVQYRMDANAHKTPIKTYRFIFLLFLFVVIFNVGNINTIHAASTESLSKKIVVMYQGQTKKLKVSGAAGHVQWSSSNAKIATVTIGGKVKALTAGTCRIQAVAGTAVYSCKVRVKALAFTNPVSSMVRGRQHELELNYKKAKNVLWTSSKPNVAEIRNGTVLAKTPGTAVITARWRDIAVKCTIKVTDISPELLAQAYPAIKQNKGKIVLAGSSSIDYCENAYQAFSPYQVINTAIGGTTVIQWLSWYPRLITCYKPAAVVLYVGSNDLGNGAGISGEQNADNTIRLLNKVSRKLKKVPVFYVSINPCWFRKGAWDKIKVSNSLVRKHCAKKKNLYYIDIVAAFARQDGTPDPSLFLTDQLHPSKKGYEIWKKKVALSVKKRLKKLS